MKNQLKLFLIALSVFTLSAASCNKDDEGNKPMITLTELGLENSKSVVAGKDLHVEADVVADNKIETVAVIIHLENDHQQAAPLKAAVEWAFDLIYTEFAGKKNTEFHKHIDVPIDAETGTYHFHLSVTDMDGNETVVEDEFEVTAAQL